MIRMRRILSLTTAIIAVGLVAALSGCSSDSGNSATILSVVPSGGTPVTTDLDSANVLSWVETTKLAEGTVLYLRVNRSGFGVLSYPVRFNGTEGNFGEHIVNCTALGDLVVGSGDSGSPIFTADGKFVGGLAYGIDGDPKGFLCRAGEDVLKAMNEEGGTRSNAKYPLLRFISGPSQDLLNRLNLKVPAGYVLSNTKVAPGEKTRGGHEPFAQMMAGESVFVADTTGDLCNIGAIGTNTVNLPKEGKSVIFSHQYNLAGDDIATPVYKAKMISMWNSSMGTFKEADPTLIPVGTMVADRFNGCVVDRNVDAKTYPVDVIVSVNGGMASSYHHDITAAGWSYWEAYMTEVVIGSSLDYKFDKRVGGSASGTLKVTLADGSIKTIAIAMDPKSDSTDITSEVTYWLYKQIDQLLVPGTSPKAILVVCDLTDKVPAVLNVVVTDKDGNTIYPSNEANSNTKSLSLEAGQTYTVKAWVTGWPSQSVAITSPGELNSIFVVDSTHIKVGDNGGNGSFTVTVTNTVTSETKSQDFKVNAQTTDNGGKG